MFRKIGVIVCVCVVVLSLLGGTKVQAQKVKIGAAMSSFADKWQTYLQDGVRKFGKEHADVEIMMTDGKDDPAVQLNQVETFLTQGVQAIVIVPVDISALGPIVQKCQEAKVKLVVVNRFPAQEFVDQIDVYCGSESIQAGIMQAEWVAQKLGPEGGKVGILMGPLGQEAAMMRTKGNKDVFAKYPKIVVDIEAAGNWDRAKGMQIAENWFQGKRGLKAIVSYNDEMAIGALLAAQAAGIKDEEIIIAGVDATPDALEYLGKGLDVTVFQSGPGQGYGGADAAYKLVKGQKVDKMYWIPYELVTVENMDKYKTKQQ
jgi:inositol transport system substrate-binding protein